MEIPLTGRYQHLIMLIDDADAGILTGWYAPHRHPQGYAMVNRKSGGRQEYRLVHRLVMDAKPGQWVDHINRNKLDNRRSNLRFCNASENGRNVSAARRDNITGRFRGVSQCANVPGLYRVRITVNGKEISGGCFWNRDDAITRRLELERVHFGKFSVGASA